PVWVGRIDHRNFVGEASATSTQVFNQDETGRVFVQSSSDCIQPGTPPGTLPTCTPTKVYVPVTAQQNVIFLTAPEIAGQLLVTETKGALSFYDLGCTGSGTDAQTGLPACRPLVIISEDVSAMTISDGVVYITTPKLIERWTVFS